VSDAYVPVIKFEFSSIPIDLVFARLNLPTVPEDLVLADDNLLKGLDEQDVRSVNGSRVTDEILSLVPNRDVFPFSYNQAFQLALRTIKYWAKKRAIYSNVMGFFGGGMCFLIKVAWAMVVARVAQLYPTAVAATIVSKCFSIMKVWRWPSMSFVLNVDPIILKHITDGPLQVRVWNPSLYPSDKGHKMPVITPAYPSMCSTHNVSDSTMKIMIQEFERADEIANRVYYTGPWSDLFAPSEFFYKYECYIAINASSCDRAMQLKWVGMVESRLRQLIKRLENTLTVELGT
jgi:poly(A) polymerase